MKKLHVIIISISLVTVLVLAGVGAGVYFAVTATRLSPNMFNGFQAVFAADASALGIVDGRQQSNVSTFSIDRENDQGESISSLNRRTTFVYVDIQGYQIPVYFRNQENGNIITQARMNAQFDKLYITENFIFFTITTNRINRSAFQTAYDRTNFRSNASTQSFFIDRQNNNIYSLSVFPRILRIHENTIMTWCSSTQRNRIYKLSVFQDRATFTHLTESPNFEILGAMGDTNGNVLIVARSEFGQDIIPHPTVDSVYFIAPLGTYFDCVNGYIFRSNGVSANGIADSGELEVFKNSEWVTPLTNDISFISLMEFNQYGTMGNWTHRPFVGQLGIPIDHSFRTRIYQDGITRYAETLHWTAISNDTGEAFYRTFIRTVDLHFAVGTGELVMVVDTVIETSPRQDMLKGFAGNFIFWIEDDAVKFRHVFFSPVQPSTPVEGIVLLRPGSVFAGTQLPHNGLERFGPNLVVTSTTPFTTTRYYIYINAANVPVYGTQAHDVFIGDYDTVITLWPL